MEKYSILAVDDEPFNLDLIEAAFYSYENVELSFAQNAKDALELIKNNQYDVILLDISMPQMNGLDALKYIRTELKQLTLPVLMVTANTDKEKEALDCGASDFITKPYEIDILCSRTLNYAKLNHYTQSINRQNEILEEKVHQRTTELQTALALSKETEFEISVRLGRASESRDPETGGHIKRMSHYSKLLAQLAGLSKEEVELILYASPLHDIGKIGIPDNILLKPGRFEPYEFEIMKTHAKLGAQMLEGAERFPILNAGKIIALEHHEKYDGSGYPGGLKGEEIHFYARIVAIADVFDALSAKRCYKEAMPLEKVLSIMKNGAGEHFDPQLIKLFLDNIDKFLEIKEIYKDENCLPFNKDIAVQSSKKVTLMFVDDNAFNRVLVEEMLMHSFPNATIKTSSSAEKLLLDDPNQFDIILTDIMMPDIDGYELFTILRKKYAYKKPIIAITALNTQEDIQKIQEYGFDAYVSKPLDINELEATLKTFIEA